MHINRRVCEIEVVEVAEKEKMVELARRNDGQTSNGSPCCVFLR